MPIRLPPLGVQRLGHALPQAGLKPAASPSAEPAIPVWFALLTSISLWLNRLFLGLVMALIGFTLWQWWQG